MRIKSVKIEKIETEVLIFALTENGELYMKSISTNSGEMSEWQNIGEDIGDNA